MIWEIRHEMSPWPGGVPSEAWTQRLPRRQQVCAALISVTGKNWRSESVGKCLALYRLPSLIRQTLAGQRRGATPVHRFKNRNCRQQAIRQLEVIPASRADMMIKGALTSTRR
jgi:hypothetical protein